MKIKKLNKKGITFIEAVIGIGLVTILTTSIFVSLNGAAINMSDAKQRTGAVALANEQVEILRHLPYEKVGTISNAFGPDGPIDREVTVSRNNFTYRIVTDIRYKDDPYDGLAGEDTVNTPNDYKLANVKVYWRNKAQDKFIEFTSTFIPNGLETELGGGTLSINVINSSFETVPNFTAHITSLDNNPAADITVESDVSGNLIFPGTSAQRYRIVISKDGYAAVRTYPNPPASAFTPIDPDLLVTEGALNMKTFTLDRAADLTLKAVDVVDGSGVSNISFHLTGGRKIGTNPDTFSVDYTGNTDSNGEIKQADINPGVYNLMDIDALETDDYFYLGTDVDLPFDLVAEEDKTANFLFARKNVNSIVARVNKEADGTPIEGASVHVSGNGFDQIVMTDKNGLAYFPPQLEVPVTLEEKEYQISITADGYADYNDNVTVNDLTVKDVILTAN